jgi:hypothetical protein
MQEPSGWWNHLPRTSQRLSWIFTYANCRVHKARRGEEWKKAGSEESERKKVRLPAFVGALCRPRDAWDIVWMETVPKTFRKNSKNWSPMVWSQGQSFAASYTELFGIFLGGSGLLESRCWFFTLMILYRVCMCLLCCCVSQAYVQVEKYQADDI